jgi:zinc protease
MEYRSFLVFVFFLSFTSQAQIVVDSSKLKFGSLENGVTYYIIKTEEHSDIRMTMVVNAGVNQEDSSQIQYSHLLEHLAFSQTPKFMDAYDFFAKFGLRRGYDINAQISSQNAEFFLKNIPSTKAPVFDLGLQFLASIVNNVKFDSLAVVREAKVVQNELTGVDRVEEQYQSKIISNPKYNYYTNREAISSLGSVKMAELERFYRTWYRSDNVMVAIVGNVDVEVAFQRIKSVFGRLVPPSVRKPLIIYPECKWTKQFITVGNGGSRMIDLIWICKFPSIESSTIDGATIDILYRVISRLFNVRNDYLNDSISVIRNRYFNFSNHYNRYGPVFGGLEVGGSVETDNDIVSGYQVLVSDIERIRRFGFAEQEFDEVVDAMMKELTDRSQSLADATSEIISHYNGLSPFCVRRDRVEFEIDVLKKADLTRLNNLVCKILSKGYDDLILRLPIGVNLSCNYIDSIHNVVSRAKQVSVDSLVIKKKTQAEEVSLIIEPVIGIKLNAGKVTRSTDKNLGITKVELKNGVCIYLRPTSDGNDSKVFVRALSPTGAQSLSRNDYFNAVFAPYIAFNGGCGRLNKRDFEKYKARNQVNFDFSISESEASINGDVEMSNVSRLFQCVLAIFDSPKADFEYFQSFSMALGESFKRNRSDGMADSINSMMNDIGVPSAPAFTLNDLGRLDYSRSVELYKRFFGSGHNFTFFITGNFVTDSMVVLVEKYLSRLPIRESNKVDKLSPAAVIEGGGRSITFGTNNSSATIRIDVIGVKRVCLYDRVYLEIFGRYIEQVLFNKLRVDAGLTYFVGLNFSTRLNNLYTLSVVVSCNPTDANKVREIIRMEFENIYAYRLERDVLLSVRDVFRSEYLNQRSRSDFWMKGLIETVMHQCPASELWSYLKYIDQVDSKHMRQIINSYFRGKPVLEVILMPDLISPNG